LAGSPSFGRRRLDRKIPAIAVRPPIKCKNSPGESETFSCSQEEQRAIAKLFSEDEAAVSDVMAMLDTEAADAARLKQSILKAAFEGRLVQQDSSDEPAGALLARLGAQASAAPARRARMKSGGLNAP
jgi:hypothetical protein